MVYGDRIHIVGDNYYQPKTVFGLQVLQCCLNIILIFWIRLYLRILLKSSACHPNLLVLLSAQPLIHLLALTARNIRFLAESAGLLTDRLLIVLNFISDIGISATCIIVLGYCIERIIAMRNIESYERMYRPIPWLGLGILFSSLLYATILLTLWYEQILKSMIVYIAQIGLFSCSGFFFIAIKINADRAYQKMARHRYSSVNQRYQTAMNFKAAQLLLYLAPYKCLSSFFILVGYAWVYDRVEPQYVPLCIEVFFLYNYLQVSLQILLVLLCHSTLRRLLLDAFGLGRIRKRKISDVCVRSITGSRLEFRSNAATDLYFASLQKAWEYSERKEQPAAPQSPESIRKASDLYRVA
ncbi:unnamed protein product, partial [Mesorhabditis spiculigera]